MSWPPGRTALYRLYDSADALLYIGIAHDPGVRWSRHASTKPWWPDVARKAVEWHDEREIAEALETAAITAEHPRYNVANSPWAPKPRELEACEMTVGEARKDLTDLIARVRLRGELITLVDRTRDRRPAAMIVPTKLGEAIIAAGGPEAALNLLRDYAD